MTNDTTMLWTIPPQADGWRLDKALELLLPGVGLRGRRRLVESGLATVNGRARAAGYRVRAGQTVAVVPQERERRFGPADVPVVLTAGDYALLNKPAGLHSAALAQGGGESVEALLPAIFPGRPSYLLSRLDSLTTGLLPAAFSQASAASYRDMEESGEVDKTYLAVGHGEPVATYFRCEGELDAADRKKTRVLERATIDSLRMTEVEALETRGGLTLFRCTIKKGARHQIRTHLAWAGHPLVGDPLYGFGEGERLYLHCAGIDCPAFAAVCDAPWSLGEAVEIVSLGAVSE